MKTMLIISLLFSIAFSFSYQGRAGGQWTITLRVDGFLFQNDNISFIFDSGSGVQLTLNQTYYSKYNQTGLNILGQGIMPKKSIGKYKYLNILGTQFLTSTNTQIIKEVNSKKFFLTTFWANQPQNRRSAPQNSIHVSGLQPTDPPIFEIPDVGKTYLDTGASYNQSCIPSGYPVLVPNLQADKIGKQIKVQNNTFCLKEGPYDLPLVTAHWNAWRKSQIGFSGYNGKQEFWISKVEGDL